MHTALNISTNNERGINTLTKRQQLAYSWDKEKIDIAMMAETQKNTGGMESGKIWGNEYTAFFSTGIKPKVKDNEERKRLEKWEKAKKRKMRKRTNTPQPIAKPMSKEKRQEAKHLREQKKTEEDRKVKGQPKGIGKGPSRRDPDFEHAGVGIAVKKNG
jgi:murein L,D-transpeptidase YafK